MKVFKAEWGFLVSGSCLGLLFVLALYMLDSVIGMNDAYIAMSEYCASSLKKIKIDGAPPFFWETAFFIGIFLGAILAAILGNDWKFSIMPDENSGKGLGVFASAWVAPFEAFIGGFLVMLGLQFAGDTFLGQWTAAVQLSTSAWIFLFVVLLSGIGATLIIKKFAGSGEG